MALKIAVFGQAPFGRDVTQGLADAGHEIVAVYAPPEGKRPDPLAELAEERGYPLFRYPGFRRKGAPIAERLEEYLSLDVDLNVMPFTTVFLPQEILDAPKHRSMCFHPSLLPAYRGGAALAWQIMLGAKESGVSVFQPDEGVDTGPLFLQKGGVPIADDDTTVSLYFDKLYDLGVKAMLEAVEQVAEGTVQLTPQVKEGDSFQGLVKDEDARIDWSKPGVEVSRRIRGCDPAPGGHALRGEDVVRLHGARLHAEASDQPAGTVLGLVDDRLQIAVNGGVLSVAKVKVGAEKKVVAAECGLEAGEQLR